MSIQLWYQREEEIRREKRRQAMRQTATREMYAAAFWGEYREKWK
jgi:hypothetical protein